MARIFVACACCGGRGYVKEDRYIKDCSCCGSGGEFLYSCDQCAITGSAQEIRFQPAKYAEYRWEDVPGLCGPCRDRKEMGD